MTSAALAASGTGSPGRVAGSGFVLSVLASGQFLMTLDSSVMNVSIRQVAADVGTTVTGIQTAITLYTLVMASLMITGGKIGAIVGRRRAFSIGLVIYGAGSLTTGLAPNLGVLLVGWPVLEGVGAALIMPAIVALVAGNFPAERRAAAGAITVAAGGVHVRADQTQAQIPALRAAAGPFDPGRDDIRVTRRDDTLGLQPVQAGVPVPRPPLFMR